MAAKRAHAKKGATKPKGKPTTPAKRGPAKSTGRAAKATQTGNNATRPASKPGRTATKDTRVPGKATRRANESTTIPVKPAKTKYVPKTAGPTSTESERLKVLHAELDGVMHHLFPDVQNVFAYEMHGWKVPRRKTVEWTKGTMDPNWFFLGLAERKTGITLHVWNPMSYDGLAKNRAEFEAAGFKVMVGCLQFNRKSAYPVDVVVAMLDRIQRQMDAERGS